GRPPEPSRGPPPRVVPWEAARDEADDCKRLKTRGARPDETRRTARRAVPTEGENGTMSYSRDEVKAITDRILNMASADAVEVEFSGGERSATRYANSSITANLIEHDQQV